MNSQIFGKLASCLVIVSAVVGPVCQAGAQSNAALLLKATGLGERYEGVVDWGIETQNKLCQPEELGDGQGDTFAIDRASLQAAFERIVNEEFSDAQLEDLVAFYETPLGSRLVHESRNIESQGSDIIDRALAFWRRDSLVALGQPMDSLDLLGLPETPEPSDAAPGELNRAHRAAAASLFEVSPWRPAFRKSLERGVSANSEIVASSESLPKKVQERLARTRDWDRLAAELETLIAQSFTEAELRELIAFFTSPSGQYFVSRKEKLDERLLGEITGVLSNRQKKSWEAGC